MKYGLKPWLMYTAFKGSFRKQVALLPEEDASRVMSKARQTYKDILSAIPEFDSDDRFIINILSAALLAAVYMNLHKKPGLAAVTQLYHNGMTNAVMRLFLKAANNYTPKAQQKLKEQATASQRKTNPYSWRFEYQPGSEINEYSAVFSTCGIKRLFDELGISEITPAMCSYDYVMADLAGSIFTREFTLAAGGPCCDCHYRKKPKSYF